MGEDTWIVLKNEGRRRREKEDEEDVQHACRDRQTFFFAFFLSFVDESLLMSTATDERRGKESKEKSQRKRVKGKE